MRSSNLELPDAAELGQILLKESPRQAVRYDYLDTHPEIFEAYSELAQKAEASVAWVHDYPRLALGELIKEINVANAQLARYIEHHQDEALCEKVFMALAVEEMPVKSDGIFVFGSPSNLRIERAVELYQQNIAPRIIISGRGPHYGLNDISEARRMAQAAIDAGIPEDALVLEGAAITIPDNVKRTLDLFESMSWRPKSLTIIASAFVLRRAMMDWYKFTPWDITIHAVAPHSSATTAQNWCNSSEGISLVLNEYAKLVIESKIDLMRREKL